VLENLEFARFAAHWGFRIRACRPYRARTKGKVERPVGYVRQGSFYGRDFLNDEDLKMPGSLEAVDGILAEINGGHLAATEAINCLLSAQITLRNNRRLKAAMRSSRTGRQDVGVLRRF